MSPSVPAAFYGNVELNERDILDAVAKPHFAHGRLRTLVDGITRWRDVPGAFSFIVKLGVAFVGPLSPSPPPFLGPEGLDDDFDDEPLGGMGYEPSEPDAEPEGSSYSAPTAAGVGTQAGVVVLPADDPEAGPPAPILRWDRTLPPRTLYAATSSGKWWYRSSAWLANKLPVVQRRWSKAGQMMETDLGHQVFGDERCANCLKVGVECWRFKSVSRNYVAYADNTCARCLVRDDRRGACSQKNG
jgi:hypothetical protein